jgi:hypothetical protein
MLQAVGDGEYHSILHEKGVVQELNSVYHLWQAGSECFSISSTISYIE